MYSFLSIFATTLIGYFEEITAKHDDQKYQKQKEAAELAALIVVFSFLHIKRKHCN
jgi:hypothetical protein